MRMKTPYVDENGKRIFTGDILVNGRKNSRKLKVQFREYEDTEEYEVFLHYGFTAGKEMTLPDAIDRGWYKKVPKSKQHAKRSKTR